MTAADELTHRVERLERLRNLGLHRGAQELVRPTHPAPVQPGDQSLPGDEAATPFGPAWVRVVRYPLTAYPELAGWISAPPGALAALDRNNGLLAMDPVRAVFVDTETTGLSLGTDTYTFLIGIGEYEADAFVVRQFFMRSPAEERAQLHLVEEALARGTGLVTFNGRAFDLPLICNRFLLARMPPPLAGAPHLDLLPPARRLWRGRWQSCSLGSLERNVLGVQRTADDVPGYLIPDIYREYYRTGTATEMLARVFYHNLQDVVSMTLLGARMARSFDRAGLQDHLAALHPLECLSLGHCYAAIEWPEAGIAAYRAALDGLGPGPEQIEAMRALGWLYKRLGRRAEAVELWERWIGTVPGDDVAPYVELAKHHEWHTRDLAAARGWAAWALRLTENWPPGITRDQARAELQHRLARLESKLVADETSG